MEASSLGLLSLPHLQEKVVARWGEHGVGRHVARFGEVG